MLVNFFYLSFVLLINNKQQVLPSTEELTISTGRGLTSVLMLSKCGKGSVGGGESGKKAKTTPDVGGKSVSEKSQDTHLQEPLREIKK
jgi:hypothetical protein